MDVDAQASDVVPSFFLMQARSYVSGKDFIYSEESLGFHSKILQNQNGQSILEFTITLPVLISLSIILIRISSAIQISIVDQQYARARALFLAYNSSYYPTLEKQDFLIKSGANQMILGVSDNQAVAGYSPRATIQAISRGRLVGGSDRPNEEPDLRSKIRIRNTVTLCTQNLFIMNNNGRPQAILNLDNNYMYGVSASALSDKSNLNNFCIGSMVYEQ